MIPLQYLNRVTSSFFHSPPPSSSAYFVPGSSDSNGGSVSPLTPSSGLYSQSNQQTNEGNDSRLSTPIDTTITSILSQSLESENDQKETSLRQKIPQTSLKKEFEDETLDEETREKETLGGDTQFYTACSSIHEADSKKEGPEVSPHTTSPTTISTKGTLAQQNALKSTLTTVHPPNPTPPTSSEEILTHRSDASSLFTNLTPPPAPFKKETIPYSSGIYGPYEGDPRFHTFSGDNPFMRQLQLAQQSAEQENIPLEQLEPPYYLLLDLHTPNEKPRYAMARLDTLLEIGFPHPLEHPEDFARYLPTEAKTHALHPAWVLSFVGLEDENGSDLVLFEEDVNHFKGLWFPCEGPIIDRFPQTITIEELPQSHLPHHRFSPSDNPLESAREIEALRERQSCLILTALVMHLYATKKGAFQHACLSLVKPPLAFFTYCLERSVKLLEMLLSEWSYFFPPYPSSGASSLTPSAPLPPLHKHLPPPHSLSFPTSTPLSTDALLLPITRIDA